MSLPARIGRGYAGKYGVAELLSVYQTVINHHSSDILFLS